MKSGDRAFKEHPSTGRPEAILGDAWISTHLKVIESARELCRAEAQRELKPQDHGQESLGGLRLLLLLL